MKKVALHNLGCKVNAYETEAMQELLEYNGYEIVPFAKGADIYIINTCTVTNMADRKSRQMLHKAKKMNPKAIVVAVGCYVQAQEAVGEVDDCIDIIIGNNKKGELVSILRKYEAAPKGVEKAIVDISHTDVYERLHLSKTAGHTRAYIKVQDGCNQFCTYCIIPYTRGRVRSRAKISVLQEVEELVGNGYQEIVLTGIHLSSYGVDFIDEQGHQIENLLSLIEAVHQVEGVERIRLGSLEPGIITEEFVKTIAGLRKICPHFHLSLQSGCNTTLKRMNRRYTVEEYADKCRLLRQYFKNPALTTDVIVGFPGETQAEFEDSFSFIDGINFYETHIFKYSKREGTQAAKMECQVDDTIKSQRSSRLLELDQKKRTQYENQHVGMMVEVLLEETIEKDGKTYQTGHTKEYIKVAVEGTDHRENERINLHIQQSSQIIH
ncbi:MAG: tRNA (N(6)-L-threonylcarbamoyladenosine(37)-C(2))-methylthiotransferase MtaB [Lachnospiraceae bacterium]